MKSNFYSANVNRIGENADFPMIIVTLECGFEIKYFQTGFTDLEYIERTQQIQKTEKKRKTENNRY